MCEQKVSEQDIKNLLLLCINNYIVSATIIGSSLRTLVDCDEVVRRQVVSLGQYKIDSYLRDMVENGLLAIGYDEWGNIGYRLSTPVEIVVYRKKKGK